MTITEKEIIKLGNLAKIGISDDEAQELEIQLNKIEFCRKNKQPSIHSKTKSAN